MPYPQEQEIQDRCDKALIDAAIAWNKKTSYRSNWASEVGHPCLRYLTYNWTHWRKRQIPDIGLLRIFKGGRYYEMIAQERLELAGYEIYKDPEAVYIEKYNIGCLLDRKLKRNGKVYPVEVKGLSHHTFNSITDVDSMFNHDYHYVRRYPIQLLLYCAQLKKSEGVFLIVDKLRLEVKPIWLYAKSYEDVVDQTFKKVNKVNRFVRKFKLRKATEKDRPARINDLDICTECCYNKTCKPVLEVSKKAGKLKVPDGYEDQLEEWWKLKPDASEYNSLDRSIKGFLKKVELQHNATVGPFVITPRPKHKAAQPAKPAQDYFEYKINRIES